ncbi:cation-transporting P-type ATPase [Halanaerobium sp. Z-7514]|uniref:P-type Ca(2+) transporter n=1 Tax=Halanaerobium polyolivorans TaxID=2886943 RepID=A0AAW4WV13_9FIRM|nr:cation-transporting P-type ATPase [Halanaerobium polyolivorans]MCC3144846.1 cation-transporting P-type ATPase [Halanaerobium polyolivorans]
MKINKNKLDNYDWYKTSIENTLKMFNTSKDGLSKKETVERLDNYGKNKLPSPAQKHPVLKFLSHYNNVLIYVLFAAAIVTALLGHWIDTIIILAVVVINGLISFIQEGKAEKALDAVKNMLSTTARIKREGEIREISAENVVIGDIIYLKSGDKVPADLRLIESKNLSINEASLTGESVPASKNNEIFKQELSLGDRKNMAYSSTIVTSGEGIGIVVATGKDTEIGRINQMISSVEKLKTPLIQQVDRFGKQLTLFILSLGFLVLLIGRLLRGTPFDELFLSVVGIAVAAIPEGLPAVITITLAIGVQRMAARNAIIRKLPAVETLGSVSIICSDKTGTLTEGQMTVKTVVTADKEYTISGNGYDPSGKLINKEKEVELSKESVLKELLKNASLNNDARLVQKENKWIIEGSPTEGALKTLVEKSSYDNKTLEKKYPRLDSIPFNSDNKFMATLNQGDDDKNIIYLKGAPEVVMGMCSKELTEDGFKKLNKDYWEEKQGTMASNGYRLLALAYKKNDKNTNELSLDHIQSEMIFLGIIGVMDPPRQEAIEAVKECQEANIKVKMITGDHATTASAIAAQLGIESPSEVITGNEINNLDDIELKEVIERTYVFARVSPEHKLRLVTAMQELGYITAMTGDGVNDAPALKKSDIGVAMGINGTEATKEAAEMVLADDNFASIINAVEEGRTVYDNLKKALLFMLPTNGGEALVIMAAVLFGFSLPITPVQILWINMITAVTLALTLAFEPMEEDAMKRPPRDTGESLTPFSLLLRIGFVSVILTATTLGIYTWAISNNLSLPLARSLAVNMLVYGEIFYLFNSRYMTKSSLNLKGFKATPWVWKAVGAVIGLQFIFVYFPPIQTIFDVAPLKLSHWLIIIGINFLLFLVVELEKYISRNFY